MNNFNSSSVKLSEPPPVSSASGTSPKREKIVLWAALTPLILIGVFTGLNIAREQSTSHGVRTTAMVNGSSAAVGGDDSEYRLSVSFMVGTKRVSESIPVSASDYKKYGGYLGDMSPSAAAEHAHVPISYAPGNVSLCRVGNLTDPNVGLIIDAQLQMLLLDAIFTMCVLSYSVAQMKRVTREENKA